MTDVIIPVLLFSIPIVGIVGWTCVRIVESIFGKSGRGTKKLTEKVRELEQEKLEQEKRLENLETIITGIDPELIEGLLKLESFDDSKKNRRRVEEMAASTKPKKEGESIEENLKSVVNKVLAKVENMLDEEEPKKQHPRRPNEPYRPFS